MTIFDKNSAIRLQVQDLAYIFDTPLLAKTSKSILDRLATLLVTQNGT